MCKSNQKNVKLNKEVGDDLYVCVLNLEFVSKKIEVKSKNISLKFLYQESFLEMLHCSKNFKELSWAL